MSHLNLEKLQASMRNVHNWMTIMELHWERVLGDFYNDELIWQDLFHNMQAADWWDFITIGRLLELEEPQFLRNFTKFGYNLDVIEKRLHATQPVIKPYNRQGYNKAAVSVFCAIRDTINELKGTPTRRWTDKERASILKDRENSLKPAQILFQVANYHTSTANKSH